ncbi:hypothetical protein PAPYR_4064 [Paratrimastix pyriformis]|uniref:Transmembrane 9 superfamily member n=1 Tax=Paratrimastix pyriformis TaxID=342808 RepID=A0ABQ8ULA8_9EUKA|nr:hypothetical protein PAPYR_4064 [Paratrimastix pyriformis]
MRLVSALLLFWTTAALAVLPVDITNKMISGALTADNPKAIFFHTATYAPDVNSFCWVVDCDSAAVSFNFMDNVKETPEKMKYTRVPTYCLSYVKEGEHYLTLSINSTSSSVSYVVWLNSNELIIPWSAMAFTGGVFFILSVLFEIAFCLICRRKNDAEIDLSTIYTNGYKQKQPQEQQRLIITQEPRQPSQPEAEYNRGYRAGYHSGYSRYSYYDGGYYYNSYYYHPYLFPNTYCYCGSCNCGNCCTDTCRGCSGVGDCADCKCDQCGSGGGGDCKCNGGGKADCNCGGGEGGVVIVVAVLVLLVIAVLMVNVFLMLGSFFIYKREAKKEPKVFTAREYPALYRKYIKSLLMGVIFGLGLNLLAAWTFGVAIGFAMAGVYLPCFLLAAMGIFSTNPSVFRSFARMFSFYFWIPAIVFMNAAYVYLGGAILHWLMGWFIPSTNWFLLKIFCLLVVSTVVLYAGLPPIFGARGMRNILRSMPGLPVEFDDGRGFPLLHISLFAVCSALCAYFVVFWWDYPVKYSWSIWGGLLAGFLAGGIIFALGMCILAPNPRDAKPLMIPDATAPPPPLAGDMGKISMAPATGGMSTMPPPMMGMPTMGGNDQMAMAMPMPMASGVAMPMPMPMASGVAMPVMMQPQSGMPPAYAAPVMYSPDQKVSI